VPLLLRFVPARLSSSRLAAEFSILALYMWRILDSFADRQVQHLRIDDGVRRRSFDWRQTYRTSDAPGTITYANAGIHNQSCEL
jgi:hypothetical protein